MLDNKEDFILFIGSDTCSACQIYEGTLNNVIEEYNVDVKYVDLSKLSDKDESVLTSEFPITGTPTTVFIVMVKRKILIIGLLGVRKKVKLSKNLKKMDI